MADLLRTVIPEPLQAGKNPVTPFDGMGGVAARVTCATACKRVLGDCLVEAMMASGKISRKQIESIQKSGMMDKLKASLLKTCRTNCGDPRKKKHAMFHALKRCATKTTCVAVGACAVLHLK